MNRRILLKQIGLGIAGVGFGNLQTVASPSAKVATNNFPGAAERIFLNANENPYGPPPLARKAIEEKLTMSNRYNWELASQLIAMLAKKNDVAEENVSIGAGSTEMLDMVSRLAASHKGSYVIADPTFNYWTATLDNLGMNKVKVPLNGNKELDLPAMSAAVNQDTRLLYICNPNNPSGTMCSRESLVELVKKVPGHVIILVDEAYLDFTTQPSLSSLIHELPNLVIVKTFSKIYGLAGARIGYALANKKMIDQLNQLQSSPNGGVSVLSRLAAIASLNDYKFVAECAILNHAARKYTIEELEKLNCRCIPSNTSFIYFSLDNFKGDYFQLLKDNKIEGTRIYEAPGKWTRITVGTMAEMKQFVRALQ